MHSHRIVAALGLTDGSALIVARDSYSEFVLSAYDAKGIRTERPNTRYCCYRGALEVALSAVTKDDEILVLRFVGRELSETVVPVIATMSVAEAAEFDLHGRDTVPVFQYALLTGAEAAVA